MLWRTMFRRYLPPGTDWWDLGEFGAICTVLAVAVLFLDWVLQTTRGRSLIDIGYENKRKIVVIPAWCIASGIVGVLAVRLEIVQMKFLAAVMVAAGWPLVFAKIVELGAGPADQRPTTEVKEKCHLRCSRVSEEGDGIGASQTTPARPAPERRLTKCHSWGVAGVRGDDVLERRLDLVVDSHPRH